MEYLELLKKAEKDNIKVHEYTLTKNLKGLYYKGNIAIDKNIDTLTEKKCILAEEIGHHHKNAGNILDQDNVVNIKQERLARAWGYERLVGIVSLINAFENGIRNKYELAEYLGVTEDFLTSALLYYSQKYANEYEIDNYLISFYPLAIWKRF